MPKPPPPAFQVALGKATKARRNELKLTQEQIHLRSDIHQRWISNVETGKRNPAYRSLRRLAEALDLRASELIALAEAVEEAGQAAPSSAEKQARKATASTKAKAR